MHNINLFMHFYGNEMGNVYREGKKQVKRMDFQTKYWVKKHILETESKISLFGKIFLFMSESIQKYT